MPEDLRLLALSVAPAKAFSKTNVSDPSGMSGKMAVVQWVPSNGREARYDFEAQRGTLANFPRQAPTPSPGQPAGKPVDFITDAILLDMHIAQVDKETNGTGEIIVVDGQGRLRVYSQLEGELEDALHAGQGRGRGGRSRCRRRADDTPAAKPGGDQPIPSRRPPLQEGGPPRRGLDFPEP